MTLPFSTDELRAAVAERKGIVRGPQHKAQVADVVLRLQDGSTMTADGQFLEVSPVRCLSVLAELGRLVCSVIGRTIDAMHVFFSAPPRKPRALGCPLCGAWNEKMHRKEGVCMRCYMFFLGYDAAPEPIPTRRIAANGERMVNWSSSGWYQRQMRIERWRFDGPDRADR